jgi:serine/threonine-protein kinase
MAPSAFHPEPRNSDSADPCGDCSPEAIREQITRILASEMFANSTRMQRFLALVVDYALSGRSSQLKEYLIGVEAFDKPSSFDPKADPIVRVEARRLRRKLKEYYDGPGSRDSLLVEFSKGSYAPRFAERTVADDSAPRPKSIAVLPFRSLGPVPDHDYFSDGLSEELIHMLTTVPGLQVVAWHSSARLKDSQNDLAHIRQQLKVDTVLAGTVRRSADQLRITVQLIDTATGRYLWSELYERRMQDLFAIEEDIAWSIVNTLQVRLVRGPVSAGARQKTPNIEAHNLYLLGRFYANRRTIEGLEKSIGCFEKVIALDPDNAMAYGALSETYLLSAEYGCGLPARFAALAKSAARRALDLDPLLAEAYTCLGSLRGTFDWEWSEGERLLRRAIELNPGYATAHHWLSVDHLANLGRFDEAFQEIDIACRLDPLSAIILQGRGYLYFLTGQYEESLLAYQELLEFDAFFGKSFSSMGRLYTQMGRYTDAIDMYQKAQSLGGDGPQLLGALGQTYGLAGMESAARQTLHQLTEISKSQYTPATCFALIHLGLGEYERALEHLAIGLERHDLPMTCLKVHPAYDTLRSRPEFKIILQRINLE